MAKRKTTKRAPRNKAAQPAAVQAPVAATRVDEILGLMESQGMTMTNAALTLGISSSTAWDWLQDPAVKERYRRAQLIASHRLVDQAEEALLPDNDGATLAPHQVTLRIARAKQKLWRAGRLNPEFAEKHVLTHEGSPDKPVHHNVVMTPSEAYQRMLKGQ